MAYVMTDLRMALRHAVAAGDARTAREIVAQLEQLGAARTQAADAQKSAQDSRPAVAEKRAAEPS